MFMRRRPLLRAAMIGGGAYVAGKKSAQRSAEQAQEQQQTQRSEDEQNERIASLEQQQAHDKGGGQAGQGDQPRQGPAAVPKPSMLDQLNQLNQLHKQGALSDSEFTAAKAKLLGSA